MQRGPNSDAGKRLKKPIRGDRSDSKEVKRDGDENDGPKAWRNRLDIHIQREVQVDATHFNFGSGSHRLRLLKRVSEMLFHALSLS